MTKHWPEQSLLAPAALFHRGEHRDNQLDFCRNVQRGFPSCGLAQQQQQQLGEMAPQQQQQQPSARTEHPGGASGLTGQATPAHPSYPDGEDANAKLRDVTQATWRSEPERSVSCGGKKKNYQRYPKPPYSYLAMIAMVIQRSPEKKLTLSEILKEISTLFPFFKGNYKGWRDSVRHNLSSYDCFVKVLKDPGKPQGKGNFWAVDLNRIPLELLKRQNTAVSRQDETIFAQDLAPYILQGHRPESEAPPPPAECVTSLPSASPGNPSPSQEDLFRPKLDSSFAIDSLLHSLRPASASGEVDRDCWAGAEHPRPSPPPRPHYASSASSVSPASTSSSSDEEWKGVSHTGKRFPPDGGTGSDGYEDHRPPMHKSARRETVAPPWELPTSYAKYAPPNAVAPPSMRFNGGPLMPLHGGLPLYSYGSSPMTPAHFLGHSYWPILPGRRVSVQPPPLLMDLDNMLQSVPPNKSVFDALLPANQNPYPHHPPQSQYTLQNGAPLNRYHQY
ncbi:forkhead box protein H1 [Fundulus heteroclitus]|uniref:forkhead box protein H1 n=1 Tax=Fundulus heteroclitus TaxID=8078 RepID=UPI00165BF45B|nr:forkhead box protein H1 [Fundulus heteroclitus]